MEESNFLEDLSLHCECDLDFEDRNPTFLHDTPGHDDAPPHQVWLQTVSWFARRLPDKGVTGGHTDRLRDVNKRTAMNIHALLYLIDTAMYDPHQFSHLDPNP